jgi:hypothetical protein
MSETCSDPPFDYGKKLNDGQYECHPVLIAGNFIRPVREVYLHAKCGKPTRMGLTIADTFARNHRFYTHTFCGMCHAYFPVEEFCWQDGTAVGS